MASRSTFAFLYQVVRVEFWLNLRRVSGVESRVCELVLSLYGESVGRSVDMREKRRRAKNRKKLLFFCGSHSLTHTQARRRLISFSLLRRKKEREEPSVCVAVSRPTDRRRCRRRSSFLSAANFHSRLGKRKENIRQYKERERERARKP